jgi:hypothetical protein
MSQPAIGVTATAFSKASGLEIALFRAPKPDSERNKPETSAG